MDMSPKPAKAGEIAFFTERSTDELCKKLNVMGVDVISITQTGSRVTAFYRVPALKAAPVKATKTETL